MHVDNARRINGVFNRLNPALASTVIPLGSPSALLAMREQLSSGGIVGILGDRIVRGDKCVTTDFLGQPAEFPVGPLLLAGILQVPVVLCFGLFHGGKHYEIRFEHFAEKVPITRRSSSAEFATWIRRYAEQIEVQCRTVPYNWFNFFDFWQEAKHAG